MQNAQIIHKQYILEKNIIYIFLFLLLFEGAIRKWIFPSLATPLLIIRDPFALLLVIQGLKKGLINHPIAKISFFISFIALLISLTFPNANLLVCMFGARVFMLYIPCIFVISKILTIKDLYNIARYCIYISIPMTVLVILQFYSPQTAWVNRGIGNNMEGSGFGGALGYFRPSGIFSFTQGFVCFQTFVCTFLMTYFFDKRAQIYATINKYVLYVAMIMFLITIPLSISRTLLFQTIAIFIFLIIGLFITHKNTNSIFKFIIPICLLVPILTQFESIQLFINVFAARFESAQHSEGNVLSGTIGNRYFGALIRAWTIDSPTFGYGIGSMTRVGIKIIGHNIITDEEWTRIIYESGFILGTIFILIRIILCFKITITTIQRIVFKKNILPFIFLPNTLFLLPQGNLVGTVPLGFTIIAVSFSLITLKYGTRKKSINKKLIQYKAQHEKNTFISSLWKSKCQRSSFRTINS